MSDLFERLSNRPVNTARPGGVPSIDFAAGREAARTSEAMARAFDRLSSFAFKKTSEANQLRASEAAAVDPSGTLKALEGQSRSSFSDPQKVAYNTAIKVLSSEIEVKARRAFGELALAAEQSQVSPTEFQTQLDTAVVGFSKSIEMLSPEAEADLQLRLDTLKDSYFLNHSKDYIKRQRQEDRATGLTGLTQITLGIEDMARAGLADFDARLDEEIANLGFYLEHHQYSSEEIATQQEATRELAHKARLRGQFEDLETSAERAEFVSKLEKDISSGGQLSRGLEDTTLKSLLSEFNTFIKADAKALKGLVTDLSSRVSESVTSVVNKGAVPEAGVLTGLAAEANILAKSGADVSEIMATLQSAASDADYIRSLNTMNINELKSERTRLRGERDTGATPSELLRLKAVNTRFGELSTIINEQEAVFKDVASKANKAIGELETIVNDMRPLPDGAFDPIDEAITALEGAEFDGAAELRAELITVKSRAAFYQDIIKANPQNLEQLKGSMLERIGAEGATPESNKRLNAIESRLSAMSSALSTDPLAWGQETGQVTASNLILDVLMISAPARAEGRATTTEEKARIAQVYNTRRTEAITFARKMGVEPVFLTDAEATSLATTLNTGDVDIQLGILSEINTGFGVYSRNVLQTLSKDAPELAHIGGLLNAGASQKTVTDALSGLALMKEGLALEPSGASRDQKDLIMREVGSMASMPKTFSGLIATADAIYAARAGSSDKARQIFDGDLYKKALQEAAGGLVGADGNTYGGVVKFEGNAIIIPSSIKQDDFDDLIEDATVEMFTAAAGGSLPLADNGEVIGHERLLNGIRLTSVQDGKVEVQLFEGGVLTAPKNMNGQTYTLDLNILARLAN